MNTPIVSIVGRPNVGKSTLFNRLLKERKSLVEDIPGVTRDRIYGECSWDSRTFMVIDTGGLDTASEEAMKKSIASQVKAAIDESDCILIMFDVRDGLLPEDREVVNYVRSIGKPMVLCVNKVDGPRQELAATEFYELGEDLVFFISSTHGLRVGDLLDHLVSVLPMPKPEEELPETELKGIRITFLGRPNAGKSSIINRIIEENRLLVDDVAGTTMDAVEVPFVYGKQDFVLVD
ncbi:50S ribosome-binding GTPase, partial [Myxococcota bacterium]|nr:50S ribosome-binding GTPase [Myxococcota bacterium]